jgi:hypothetical protein
MKNSYNSNAEIAISRSHRAHNLKSNDCALSFFIIAPGVMHSIPSRAEDCAPPVSWTDLQPAFVGEAPEAMLAWAALHLKRTYFRAMKQARHPRISTGDDRQGSQGRKQKDGQRDLAATT